MLSLIAAPVLFSLSRWLSPMAASTRAELHFIGLLAGALTLGAAFWASRGGRLPRRELPTLPLNRPWPMMILAPSVSSRRVTQAVVFVGLALWALWTVAVTAGLHDTCLEALWAR